MGDDQKLAKRKQLMLSIAVNIHQRARDNAAVPSLLKTFT
jgi:hypothetical protein